MEDTAIESQETAQETQQSERRVCQAIRNDGKPCTLLARKDSNYCASHGKKYDRPEVKRETIPKEDEVDEEKLAKLNESASFVLDQLQPEVAKEFRIACQEHQIQDIGIYLLGLLNRLYKTVDYYNPDIEPEWDKRVVGYSDHLICRNCNRIIERPTNLKQIFCSNSCAKQYKDNSETGVVYPIEHHHETEEQQDQKAWEDEQARLYGA